MTEEERPWIVRLTAADREGTIHLACGTRRSQGQTLRVVIAVAKCARSRGRAFQVGVDGDDAAPSLFSYRGLAGGKYALLLGLKPCAREEVVLVSFMITFWAGSLPPVLERLPDAQLQHLAVFSSRSREEGRERFRLHVGYFDDLSAAERTLHRVRQWYPSAWAVPAERHAALARLPALAAPASSLPVPPEREAVACGALAIDPTRPPDAAPVRLSMHDSVDCPVAALSSLTPRETLALLEEPAAPEPAVHTFRDGGHARAPLAVSEWRAEAPKCSSKPKVMSWLKRLTA